MRLHPLLPVWFTGWMLAEVGGRSLAFGADFAVSIASNAAFLEHLAQVEPESVQRIHRGKRSGPFVFIGDEPPAPVRLRATDTVKWAEETGVAGRSEWH